MSDADLLFVRGLLRPGADDGADALAVRGGRIMAVGRTAELGGLAAARTIDLEGRTLLPGFIDAHNHLFFHCVLGRHADCRIPLGGDIADLLSRIARAATADAPAGAWLRGWGFAPYRLRERRFPTLAELDAACPNRPLAILHVSGHTAQVNSAGLSRLRVTRNSVAPPGGSIERDLDSGEPNGILHETAMQPFSLHALADEFTALPVDEQVTMLEAGATAFAALGLTTSCDALSSPSVFEIYREAERRRRLPCNVVAMPHYDWSASWLAGGVPSPAGGERVRVGAVKLFADGSLSGCTAAVSQPYQGSHNHGILHRTQAELDALVRTLDERGFQIGVHAIGDRAIAQALRAYAAVLGRGPNRLRHRLEHVGVLTPVLLAELARLDIVVATQPRMLFEQGDGFVRSCGEERIAWVYPYRALIDAGVHVAGSSDCPVVSADPVLGMRDAVLRRTEEGRVLAPEQRLDARQALRMWTEEAAYSLFMETERGRLVPGAAADLVVLAADPLATDPETWSEQLRVELTVVGGEIVFERTRRDEPRSPSASD